MSKLNRISTLAGASVLAALAMPVALHAAANPFQAQAIAGYQLADAATAEGKCGGMKDKKAEEGKCGGTKKESEGKCGGMKDAAGTDKNAEGSCGGMKDGAAPTDKKAEGKCGEAKCGADKK